jgi:hypothetical protein
MNSFTGGMPDKQGGANESQRPDPRDSNLLERVLQETLADRSVEQLSAEEMEALTAVARRHRGASLVLEPIAVELVEATLRSRFGELQMAESFWQQASRRIAATLYDSPDSQQRLSHLWCQLCELTR